MVAEAADLWMVSIVAHADHRDLALLDQLNQLLCGESSANVIICRID